MENNQLSRTLYFSCKWDDISLSKQLIENGTDVNLPNEKGETPLFIGCLKSNLEHVKLFIENEANVNQRSNDGSTPLSVATDESIIQILIDNGGDKIGKRPKRPIAQAL